ncbi:alpha/beta fold hydrolase [Streptomyces sp. NPDC012888]|uniref:alpha/beta fold hydrolase n=1 Tax=Streptomyces sp. NPDC012888 TaxID=3364855 RepID=UPI003678C851
MAMEHLHPVVVGRFRHRGAELAYEVVGHGPPVVYAHGGLVSRAHEDRMSLFRWSPLLAAGRSLVRYDARAHGRSTGRPVEADYTYPALAHDLIALLDHLGVAGPVDGIGASMGCGTVLHAAVSAPGRFSRLVLLLPPTARETRPAYALANRDAAATIEREGVDAWLAGRGNRPRPPAAADVAELPPTPPAALLPSVLRGLARSDLPATAGLAALHHPALILAWADDPGHPVTTAEMLAERLPHAELHVARTRPEVDTWGECIARFLTRHPPP